MSSPAILLALALAAEPAVATPPEAPPAAPPPAAAVAPVPAAGPVLTLDQVLKQAQENNLDLRVAREKLVQVDEISRKVLAGYLPQITVGGSYTRNQTAASFALPVGYAARDMTGTGWDTPPATGGPSAKEKANGGAFDPTQAPSATNLPGAPSDIQVVPSVVYSVDIQKLNVLGFQAKLQQGILLPALWPQFKIADLGEDLAKLNVESARREILFGVVQLYYGCVSLKEVIGIQERLLQNNLDHERDARVRVEAGAMPKIALIRAQIDRAKAEQDLERARMSYAAAKISLATLIDRKDDFEVVHPAEPQAPTDVNALVKSADQDRVDLQAARLNRNVAEKTRDATWYEFAPNLVGIAQYQAANVKGFTGEYGAWSLQLALAWTVWDGGLRESKLRENRSKVVEADLAQRNAELKARDEVRRAFLDMESAQSNRVKAEETVKLARENQSLVNVNYQAGAATQIEVSDANTQLAAAEISVIAETLNAQLAALKAVKAAGGFNPKP